MPSFIELNGTTYAYDISGKGEPFVLLHGFTGIKQSWTTIKAYLEENYQVLTIDLPGHGQTKTERIVLMDEFVDDLHELTRKLNIDSFHLLGYSLGGRSALSYAMKYGHTLRSLILESASPGLKTEKERNERVKQDEALIEMMQTKGLEQFVSYWENIPLFQSQKRLPEQIKQKIRSERLSNTVEGLVISLKGMGTGAQTPWWDRLHELDMPVLLIVGSLDDKYVSINKEMNRLIKSSKLEVVKGAGHNVHLEQAEKFVTIIKEHVQNR